MLYRCITNIERIFDKKKRSEASVVSASAGTY